MQPTPLLTPQRSLSLSDIDLSHNSDPSPESLQKKEQDGIQQKVGLLHSSMSPNKNESAQELQHQQQSIDMMSEHDDPLASHAKKHLGVSHQPMVPMQQQEVQHFSLDTPSQFQEYTDLLTHADGHILKGNTAVLVDSDGNIDFAKGIQPSQREASQEHYLDMLTERYGKEIANDIGRTFLHDPSTDLTPNLIKKMEKFAASMENAHGAQHTQKDFLDLSKDPDFQDLLKQEKQWKASSSTGAYLKDKFLDGLHGLGGTVKNSLVSSIPVIGTPINFLKDKSTGDAMRLDTLFNQGAGPNRFANEVLGSLSGKIEDQQIALGTKSAVNSVISGPSKMIPAVHVASHLVSHGISETITSASNATTKAIANPLSSMAAQKGGSDYADDHLHSRRVVLDNSETTKMSHKGSVYALMLHLSTPLKSDSQIDELAGSDLALKGDLLAARDAKSRMITELGGDVSLMDGTRAKDGNTDLQLLRLMSKPELKPAMTMLMSYANSGAEPSAQDIQQFKQRTGGEEKGFDLTALLASSQVKTEKGFNYHNAAILATRIEEKPDFDYKFYDGTSLKSIMKESPPMAPVQQQQELHSSLDLNDDPK
ncbi:hypothetical protein [Thalassomonas haliotis]|uniref:Uncharacterized protein n=1 Tax=Thalassomonas haliotis TaxID=485448 RepID=A0ABY7VEU2_9GAMM|nr:hypothetical protein [Thalassomonas haliotis]WDE12091.1 hypothetical protein H3N35_00965 [Thalassomonas haliotis]